MIDSAWPQCCLTATSQRNPADPLRQFRSGETRRRCGQGQNRFGGAPCSVLIEIDTADPGLTDLLGLRQPLQCFVADEARIDAAHCVQESFQDAFEPGDDIGKTGQ